MQPIRTASEITTHIKILPAIHVSLYQKLAKKVEELVVLGMSTRAIAKSLNVSMMTIKRARRYNMSLREGPKGRRSNPGEQPK